MAVNNSEECFAVIKLLELQHFYKDKITQQQALTITKATISIDNLEDTSNIPWFILKKILTGNYEGRKLEVRENSSSDDVEDLSSYLKSKHVPGSSGSNVRQVNPLDALIALILCCDDFLRQLIFEKLSTCQLAIPLLIPSMDTIPQECKLLLWATSTVKKQWKTRSDGTCERLMANHPLPIVSALRLGRPRISKSMVLNIVIDSKKHDIFFSSECKSDSVPKILSKGLIEMTWYIPKGNERDAFLQPFTVMNLHHNASRCQNQLSYLKKISTTSIIFCRHDTKDKDEIDLLKSWNNEKCNLILIFDGKPSHEWMSCLKSISLKDKIVKIKEATDELTIAKDITRFLKDLSLIQTTFKSINDCANIARKDCRGILVDVDTPNNLQASEDASSLMQCFSNGEFKENNTQLPLQITASDIASKQREKCKIKLEGEMRLEEYVARVVSDIKALRTQQKINFNSPSVPMNRYMESIKFLPLRRKYFFGWVTLMLDEYSIISSEKIRKHYDLQCKVLEDETNQPERYTKRKHQLQIEMEQKLSHCTLGIEHFNREMSQVYEMSLDLDVFEDYTRQLPDVAAEMLLDGHPLELMDGDATYVPLDWLNAVFNCLKNKVSNEQEGAKRIYVLSVLGVQGSGKSTMLNTMFGLKFDVSAGRCTKGAFAQLIPVDFTNETEHKCDYIMVIDTEGLRSDTDDQMRDNEIATFITGLGDATLINVNGDNISEMRDILQIVIHAFIKMEAVNVRPRCLFVHHNVSDLTAFERNTSQRIRLRAILNETTQLATRQQTSTFTDIIRFNEDEDIIFTPNLWQGNPPMAPQNPEYCETILKVRNNILAHIKMEDCQTIEEFKYKLSSLWTAVLYEDFVFSFKNTSEISAYNGLETEYITHSREFRRKAMEICNELVIQCRNMPAKKLEDEGDNLFDEKSKCLSQENQTFFQEVSKYYTKNKKAERWRDETKQKMTKLHKELQTVMKKEFDIAKSCTIWRQKIDNQIYQYEKSIGEQARSLVNQFKDSEIPELEIARCFNESWDDCVKKIPPFTDQIYIEVKLQSILQHTFPEESGPVQKLLNDTNGMDRMTLTKYDICNKCTLKTAMTTFLQGKSIQGIHKEQVKIHCQETMMHAKKIISDHKRNGNNCNEHVLSELVDEVSKQLKHLPDEYIFEFTPSGIARHTVCILLTLLSDIKDLQETFRINNDLQLYIKNRKDLLWHTFKNECMVVGNNVKAAFVFAMRVVADIEDVVLQHCSTEVIDQLRSSPKHKQVLANKRCLHARMLIDLGTMKSFDMFKGYIINPRYRMSCWLGEYIQKALEMDCNVSERTVLQSCYEKSVSNHFQEATLAINRACEIEHNICRPDDLWKCLVQQSELTTIKQDPPPLLDKNMDITVDEFRINILKEMNCAEKRLIERYHSESREITKNVIGPAIEFFEKDLIGCEHVCPFCQAPCDHLSDCTNHQTECHRPQGICGRRWDETRYSYEVLQKFSGRYRRNELVADLCTSALNSSSVFRVGEKWQPFKKYKEIYEDWEIKPADSESQLYWKWFMATFNKELADFHGCEESSIPDPWKEITWGMAEKDMIRLYLLDQE